MSPAELELLVIDIVERVLQHQTIDDPRVVLKREWPKDDDGAARDLAGCANAARGEPVLWVIGVDADAWELQEEDIEALDAWYRGVQARFGSGVAPVLEQSLRVTIAGVSVVALLFSTSRAPYALTFPESGPPAKLEIPWREANQTRMAAREDLLKILVPLARMPDTMALSGFLTYCWNPKEVPWVFSLDVYFAPSSGERLIVPHHSCWVQVSQGSHEIWRAPALGAPHEQSQTIHRGETELILDGPGVVRFSGTHGALSPNCDAGLPVAFTVHARPAGGNTLLAVSANLDPQPALRSEEQVGWELEPPLPWEV